MRAKFALAVSLVALAACATQAKISYYSLISDVPLTRPADWRADYGVVIGPVTVPEALDRPQIVLKVAPTRYVISDAAQWTEPLKQEIPRVLAEYVGRQLPAARVASDLQLGGQGADYRVLIDVLRFESVPDASIRLEAAWSVHDRDGARLLETRSVFTEKVGAPGIASLVAAHQKALAALGLEIAKAVAVIAKAKR